MSTPPGAEPPWPQPQVPPSRLARGASRRQSARRFYWLTAASTLLPGAGLLGTKRKRLGIVLLSVFLGSLLVVGLWAWRTGAIRSALSVAVRPGLLLGLAVGVGVGALVWCLTILLTAGQTRPHDRVAGPIRVLRTAYVIGCCLVVLAPAAVGASYLNIQRGVVDDIFSSSAGDDNSDLAGDTPNPWQGTPRVNVLLLGSDAGSDREGVRTDSMMVASINTTTGDIVLFGVPRNLENVPFPASNPLHKVFPEGYNCGDACLLNGVWTLATDRKDLFPGDPNPGLRTTRDVIQEVVGLELHRVVVIDLKGFEELVDAMGGVDINARERVPIGGKVVYGQVTGIKGWIEPGQQHMDGYHALWYARSRATTDDFSRMRRQRCVAGALLKQVDAANLVRRYPALAKAIRNNITVDIPQSELTAWVYLVDLIQSKGRIRSLPITDKVVHPARPDFPKLRATIKRALEPPPAPSPKPSTSPSSTPPSSTPKSSSSSPTTPTPTPSTSTPNDVVADVDDTC